MRLVCLRVADLSLTARFLIIDLVIVERLSNPDSLRLRKKEELMEEKEEEEQMLFVFPSKEHHENTFKRTFTGR